MTFLKKVYPVPFKNEIILFLKRFLILHLHTLCGDGEIGRRTTLRW